MPEPTIIANAIFLPWVRQGAAANIQTADTLLPNQSGRVSLPVKLRVNNAQDVNVNVRLIGAGEVTGLDPQQIVRTEPRRGNANFEPNYFAAIEFDRPDFPWLFTPAKAGVDGKLRPWLCLVVVKKQPGVALRADRLLPLPILEIGAPAKPGEELPDLAESWAWAHAQLSAAANATPAELTQLLATRPELSVSRLLCPRLLQPATDYLACVVPAFELGRKAGLNLPIQPADTQRLNPAWLPGAQQVTLPVYFHWEFRTGAAGDFESLVKLLQARPAPPEVGKRPMDISQPGFKLPPQTPPNVLLDLEGALRVPDAVQSAWPDNARQPFQQELKKIVNAPAQNPTNQDVPLVAPPIYGRWQAARDQVNNAATSPAGGTPPIWLDELNLDPRQRVVASFGTQVVQQQQEQLMASAWEQAGEIERANQRLRQEQFSLAVNVTLHARHFNRLSEDALLQVAAPAQGRVVWTDLPVNNVPNKPMSLQQRVASALIPSQAVTGATRRLTSPRGAISRRVAVQGGQRTGSFLSKLNSPPPAPPLPTGMITLNKISETIPAVTQRVRFEVATEQAVRGAAQNSFFRLVAEGEVMPPQPPRIFRPDNEAAKIFREAAAAHQAKVNPLGISIFIKPRSPLPSLKASLLQRFDPAVTVKMRVQAIVKPSGQQNPATDPLETILAAPDFPQPMYEALRDLSQDFLLPGLEHVPPNTVTLLETNAKFVESFLVGLNAEMARELLWRGFPTDQRGTCFRRFWDARGSGANLPDIEPIHRWGAKALGQNMLGGGPQKKVVLLIRGELLGRYPNAVIYAAKAVMDGGRREPGAEELYPIFRGSLQPDIVFLGFNLTIADAIANPGWFFVIQEQPTEPRFGFDVGTDFGARTHVSVVVPPPASVPLPPGAVWRKNSAHMAYITRQQPVRVAIHATQMIPQS